MSDQEFVSKFQNAVFSFASDLAKRGGAQDLKQADWEYLGCMTKSFSNVVAANVAGATDKLRLAFLLDLSNRVDVLARDGTLSQMSLDKSARDAIETYAASQIKTRAAAPLAAHP
jgi:hypothetical protein